ncbi:hypothetical protein QQ045_002488 [Rhodiola kirilowii]
MRFISHHQTRTQQGMTKLVQQTKEHLDHTRKEILKAVTQAWHEHTNKSSTYGKKVDPCRKKFRASPSKFKMERLSDVVEINGKGGDADRYWDFGQSLRDSYEIVKVYKRLKDSMVLEDSSEMPYCTKECGIGTSREGINSLRYLFDQMSSRRFSKPKWT